MSSEKKRTIFDIAMDNLKKNGVRKEDTLEYAIDQGRTTHKGPLTDEERERLRTTEISRHSTATIKEITRIYLRHFANKSIKGIDGEELGNMLVDCYNNNWLNISKCHNKISEHFVIDKKTAKWIEYVITKQAMTFTTWRVAIDRGAVSFSIQAKNSDEYEDRRFPIMDLPKYMSFIVENYGSPRFYYDDEKREELRKKIRIKK